MILCDQRHHPWRKTFAVFHRLHIINHTPCPCQIMFGIEPMSTKAYPLIKNVLKLLDSLPADKAPYKIIKHPRFGCFQYNRSKFVLLKWCKELRTIHWKTSSRACMHALNMFLMSERMYCKVRELLDRTWFTFKNWLGLEWLTYSSHMSHIMHKKKPRGHCTSMLYGLTTATDVLAGLLESLYFWEDIWQQRVWVCHSEVEVELPEQLLRDAGTVSCYH